MKVNVALKCNTVKSFSPFLNKIINAVITGLIFKDGFRRGLKGAEEGFAKRKNNFAIIQYI